MYYDDNLFDTIQRKIAELEMSIKSLRGNGNKYAEAEKDYKVKLAEKALKLRDSGVAVGMIDKVVYGDKEVAEMRFKRDVAEVLYKANMEHINATKLEIRILESQLSREWINPTSD